jgi:hypothetical protein
MRLAFAVIALALPVAALAAPPSSRGPRISASEAGESFELGSQVCGTPVRDLDAFKAKLEALYPGMTQSSQFRSGQQRIRDAIADLRRTNDDMHELREGGCPRTDTRIATVLAAPSA